ncbi:MAG: YraN family protein [Eubacteriales bacterium]|jgi:putative endonuclease
MSNQKQNLGRRGEDEAVSYLRKKGYLLLQRNYRCPLGEIDIIAREGKTLVFIEVRSRSSDRFGTPQESVNRKKILKIYKVAQYYLKAVQKEEEPVRFDVLALLFDIENQLKHLDHIKGAF